MSEQQIIQAIRKSREYIKTHRIDLESSEQRTRAYLIEPVLQAIGWDIHNPNMVLQEGRRNGGFADYVLLNPETKQAQIIVEAKKLGEDRLEQYIPQVENYGGAGRAGAEKGVITNGNVWRVMVNREGFMQFNNIMAISVMGDSDEECAKRLAETLSPPVHIRVSHIQPPKRRHHTPGLPGNRALWDDALWGMPE